jgi:hypothetical protein
MVKRAIFWVLVIVAILGVAVAVTARSSRAERAADDCLSKPNAPPPQGGHWYYRLERATNRRCWYLGPQGEKVSQAASPKQRPSARPTPQPTAEPPEAIARAIEPMPAVPVPWLDLPTSAAAIDREPASTSDRDADQQSELPSQNDMPLVWPVLTAADLAAAEASPVKSAHMLALVAAALALAAFIIRKIFRLFAVRRLRLRRYNLRTQWDSTASATANRQHVSPAFDSTVAAAHPADVVHNPVAATRPVHVAPRPATRRSPSHDIEDYDIEDSLRQLLRDWRRAA